MGATKAFNIRDLTQHAKAEIGQLNVNVKALPASAGSSNLFTVTGTIQVNALIGLVTVVSSATDQLGITVTTSGGTPFVIAAPSTTQVWAVGNVIVLPTALGGVLPAGITSTTATAKSASFFTVSTGGVIAVTSTATLTTGTVAWLLAWSPVYPKNEVATVVNN